MRNVIDTQDISSLGDDDRRRRSSLQRTVYLCRHGETALNADGRLRGRSDPELNAVGREQAHALALTLQPMQPGAILASPLRRALQTAQAIGSVCGLTSELNANLLDRDYGPQNGRLVKKVNAMWGSLDNAPGVEPLESVLARAKSALAEASERATDASVVLVSHDAINSSLLAFLDPTRWPEPSAVQQPTGCLNVLRRENGTWAVLIAGLRPRSPQ